MQINQTVEKPQKPLPIVIIGAGGIVTDAHLPAYNIAGFDVQGVFDIDNQKAEKLKNTHPSIGNVYASLPDLIEDASKTNAVFDIAVPPNHILEIMEQLPDNSAVLIQKPMGSTLEAAKQIMEICERKDLTAAVNLQLKYAPYMIAAKDIIDKGLIGNVYDMELMMCVYTPWHLWDYLLQYPRVEILYHSIHYLDLIRSFLGNPDKIYASTRKHPKLRELASTRSTIILDYSDDIQARIITNHWHEFGLEHQQSYFKIEGTNGAIKIRIGLSMDYPRGVEPKFEYIFLNESPKKWKELQLAGKWFPHAFIGTMANLQTHHLDKSKPLPHSVKNTYETMKLVEAAYQSSDFGGVAIN